MEQSRSFTFAVIFLHNSFLYGKSLGRENFGNLRDQSYRLLKFYNVTSGVVVINSGRGLAVVKPHQGLFL